MSVGSPVVEDPLVMGGAPVFRGTRVPIANVLASLEAGFGLDQLQEAYPFLTQEHLEAARSYVATRVNQPRRGRGNKSTRKLVSREVVPLPPRHR